MAASLLELLGELELAPLRRILEDRLLVAWDVGTAGALQAEQLVEGDGPLEVGDVDAVLVEPRVGRRVAVLPGMALGELDEIAAGVLDEADRHRPLLEALARGDDLGAGEGGVAGELLDVVGGDVELPERIAHLDGTVLVVALGQLELAALVGVRDDGLADLVEVGATRAGQPECLVERDRLVQVADVDAVLADP